ncbi:tripartite tricarboxylate transporter substrate binding protein [Paracraurococcus ruber]|nr:tripartite tricarboxylate transporter substrate binding protein [Paracraurococcus ruber]TDG30148.1 tripartite tricarboxylate transporter substrate binding protein [Paracraurococcus ruber]
MRWLCLILLALLPSGPVAAQELPQRSIRLIVPFAAGGGTDVVARTLAEEAGRLLRQSVVVENRTGAGAILGTEVAAKAAPDGGTLLLATLAHAVNLALYDRLPYDLLQDFRGVAFIGEVPLVLLVNPRLPADDLRGLIALLRREPGRLSYGSAGQGSAIHVAAELFRRMAQVEIVHVPYRGAAPALQDVIAGNVQMMFDSVSTTAPYLAAGVVRALAVTGTRRSAILPEVPTAAEAGLPGYEASTWNAVLAPSSTPAPILAALHRVFAEAVRAAERRLAGMGVQTDTARTPEQLDSFLRIETERWKSILHPPG